MPQMASIVREASTFGDGRLPAQIHPAIETATIAHKKSEKIHRTKFMTGTRYVFVFKGRLTPPRVKQ
jgi:hypothetical protein